MNNAVASGSYADMKIVKTRSVMQVVVEIPIEQANSFIEMFGVPVPGAEIPVAIARLNEVAEGGNADGRSPQPEVSEKPRRKFEDMHFSQQAGLLCQDLDFQKWLGAQDNEEARRAVYEMCRIESRSELNTNGAAQERWGAIVADFRQWQTTKRYEDVRR